MEQVLAVSTLAFHGYDFARILEEIVTLGFGYVEPALTNGLFRSAPMGIEIPFRFRRGSDFKIKYDPAAATPSLSEIRKALRASKDFIVKIMTKKKQEGSSSALLRIDNYFSFVCSVVRSVLVSIGFWNTPISPNSEKSMFDARESPTEESI